MERHSFSSGLISSSGIKRVNFVLVLLTSSFMSCSFWAHIPNIWYPDIGCKG